METEESPDDRYALERHPVPSGAKLILKTLVEKETFWRQRLGDKGYERALANWQAMWGTGHGEAIPDDG